MIIVTDVEGANNLLQRYSGATLEISFFDQSLKRIAMRIHLEGEDEVIYLIGVGCERICGRFVISNVSLRINVGYDEELTGDLTKINDEESGFELFTSGGFSLAKGLEREFGSSFDNFILNKK